MHGVLRVGEREREKAERVRNRERAGESKRTTSLVVALKMKLIY